MKKITLLVFNKDKEGFLESLRERGVVHIKYIGKPSSEEITANEAKIAQLKKIADYLPVCLSGRQACPVGRPDVLQNKQNSKSHMHETEIMQRAREILDLQSKKDEYTKVITDANNGINWYSPWGEFVPHDLPKLKEQGIYVKLYKLYKDQYKEIQSKDNIHVIKKEDGYYYVAAIFYQDDSGLPFEEIKIPSETLTELNEKIEIYSEKLSDIEKLINEKAVFKKEIQNMIAKLFKKHNFLEVFYGMRKEEDFSLLQGFCPVPEINTLISFLKKHNAGYLIDDPGMEEEVPTLIKNPRWLDVINPLFKFINALPGYNEFDVSFVLLLFFSLFFAIIVGDAGYGILFCLATWFARKKLKDIPPEPFRLMYVLSFATIFWGAITGTWFGFQQIAQLPFFNSLIIEKVNSFSEQNQIFIMYLCFIIGVVHLSIAHLMRFIRIINSMQALAQLGWICMLWGLFFLSGTLVINRPFPSFAGYLFLIGVIFVLVFSNFQKNILKGILQSLIDTFLGTTGAFSDIISYLRLFAVGSASVAIASSFNSMAIGIGFNSILGGISAAFILFFAHALNITLCFLAVIVHGLRLNMLEFSGHLGLQWAGIKYEPFKE